MDILKLWEKVLNSEAIQEIPILYVILVVDSVIEAINTGECFYENDGQLGKGTQGLCRKGGMDQADASYVTGEGRTTVRPFLDSTVMADIEKM